MIERVNLLVVAFCEPRNLECAICDDFIRVHVGARASPTLNFVNDKRAVEFSFGNIVACGND